MTRTLLNCSSETSLQNRSHEGSVKVYLVYDDAWWLTKLGLEEGEVRHNMTDPKLYIRYHDGPIYCISPKQCRGALLVQYAFGLKFGSAWYEQFFEHRDKQEPLGVFTDGPLPTKVHQKLMSVHADQLRAVGVDPAHLAPPTTAVVGFWSAAQDAVLKPDPAPLTAKIHPIPACAKGLTSAEFSDQLRKPVSDREIFIANNDWWLQDPKLDLMVPFWAEVSLRTTERILHDHLGMGRPRWLNATYWQRIMEHTGSSGKMVV